MSGAVDWNETYTALYGRPPETSNSWQWWIDRIHPEDRERTSVGLRSAIDGDESTWTASTVSNESTARGRTSMTAPTSLAMRQVMPGV